MSEREDKKDATDAVWATPEVLKVVGGSVEGLVFTKEIDYRQLLIKYMKGVGDSEGVSFLPIRHIEGVTEEDEAELELIWGIATYRPETYTTTNIDDGVWVVTLHDVNGIEVARKPLREVYVQTRIQRDENGNFISSKACLFTGMQNMVFAPSKAIETVVSVKLQCPVSGLSRDIRSFDPPGKGESLTLSWDSSGKILVIE